MSYQRERSFPPSLGVQGLFEIPLAAECFRGSNTPNLWTITSQLSVTSLTCNHWPALKASSFFFFLLRILDCECFWNEDNVICAAAYLLLLCIYPSSEWSGLSVTLWRWCIRPVEQCYKQMKAIICCPFLLSPFSGLFFICNNNFKNQALVHFSKVIAGHHLTFKIIQQFTSTKNRNYLNWCRMKANWMKSRW